MTAGEENPMLRAQGPLLQSIIDSFGEPVFVVDALEGEFRYVGLNAAASAYSGFSSDDLRGRQARDLMPFETAGYLEARYTECALSARTVRFDIEMTLPTGRFRRHGTVSPLLDDASEVRRLVVVSVDISAQHRANLKAQERQQLLEQAEQLAGVGSWRFDTKTNSLAWSPEVFRIHGLDPSAGAPSVERAIALYHPEDRDQVGAAVGQAIEHLQPFSFELRVVRPDGEVRHVRSNGEPELDEHGGLQAIVGVFVDATDEIRRNRELIEARQRLIDAIEAMPDAFSLFNAEGRLEACNERYREYYPNSKDLIEPGVAYTDIIRAGAKRGEYGAIKDLDAWVEEYRTSLFGPDGSYEVRTADDRVIEVTHRKITCGSVVAMRRDVTDLLKRETLLKEEAHKDELTGLLNRRGFDQSLAGAIANAQTGAPGFALLTLDLDRFKQVNDVHGHQAGDAVLRAVAGRIRSKLRLHGGADQRDGDHAARFGGDEFAIVLAGIGDEALALQISDRLRAALLEPIDFEGKDLHVGCSVGLAMFPHDGADASSLVRAADGAMYADKALRRGCKRDRPVAGSDGLLLSLEAKGRVSGEG